MQYRLACLIPNVVDEGACLLVAAAAAAAAAGYGGFDGGGLVPVMELLAPYRDDFVG